MILTVQVDRIVVLEEREAADGGYAKLTTEKVGVAAPGTAAAAHRPGRADRVVGKGGNRR